MLKLHRPALREEIAKELPDATPGFITRCIAAVLTIEQCRALRERDAESAGEERSPLVGSNASRPATRLEMSQRFPKLFDACPDFVDYALANRFTLRQVIEVANEEAQLRIYRLCAQLPEEQRAKYLEGFDPALLASLRDRDRPLRLSP